MNRSLAWIAFLCVLWVWLGWGRDWWDSHEDGNERREFEKGWWKSFRRLTFAHNSTFSLLPADVQASVSELLRKDSPSGDFSSDVAGTYHGEWVAKHSNQTTPYWNGTLPSGFSRPGDGATGRLTLVLSSEAAGSSAAELLRGSVALQSADESLVQLDVEGLYWGDSGVAVLHAAAEVSAQTAVDVVGAMASEELFVRAKASLGDAYASLLPRRKRPTDISRDCEYHVYLQFSPGPSRELVAHSLMFSPMCSVSVAAPAGQPIVGIGAKAYTLKVLRYALTAALGMAVLMLLLDRQMHHTPTPARLARVSYHSLALQAIVDSHVFVLHAIACTAVGSLVFMAAGAVAFVVFTAMLVLAMRYIAAVWRAQQPSATTPDECRRIFVRMYIGAYISLVVAVVATYAYLDTLRPLPAAILAVLMVVAHAYWVPQIWRNAKRNTRRGLRWEYVVGTTVIRLLFPLYAFAYADNIAFIRPAPLVWCLAAFSMAQVAVLVMQDVLGPRFFLPGFLRPAAHDYHPLIANEGDDGADGDLERNSLSSDGVAGPVCAVCILPVDMAPPIDNGPDCASPYMVTPCAHTYHTECLQTWMDIKLECPICRARLPPL